MENFNQNHTTSKEKTLSTWMHGVAYGLMTSGVIILIALIFYILDRYDKGLVDSLGYLILLGGLIWGMIVFKNKQPNISLSYGRSFTSGLVIGIFASFVGGAFFYLFYRYIGYDILDGVINLKEIEIDNYPNLSDTQREDAINSLPKLYTPLVQAILFIIFHFLVALVSSLIIAIFTKRDLPSDGMNA